MRVILQGGTEMTQKEVVINYPYPVAKPYSIIGDETESPQQKLWSLPFTLYQILRIVTLPLVSQYLNDGRNIDDFSEEELKSVKSINEAVARIRCPFFSDWIGLYLTLCKHMPKLFEKPFFPLDAESLKGKVDIPEAFFDLKGSRSINRMEAILALRNALAHGGQLPDEKRCLEIIDFYLPMLDFILDKFSFLSKSSLLVMTDEEVEDYQDSVMVKKLTGVEPPEQEEMEIDEELREYFKRYVVMKNEKGKYMPQFPLLIK